MGRTLPAVPLTAEVRDEVALARAVEDAVARLLTTGDVSEHELCVTVERILAEEDGARTDHVSPASAFPLRTGTVALDGVEVTQVVQDLDHSVPLVAGKPTVVRVYLSHPEPVAVRGELQAARSASGPWAVVTSLGAARLDPSRAGSTLAQLRARRADLAFSLNFSLPADMTRAGDLWLRLGPLQRTTGTALPSFARLTTRRVTFRRAAPLRLRLVRLRYGMGSPARVHEPSETDVTLIASWLRRAYPIARLDVSTTTVDAAPAPAFEAAQINAQLISLRAVDVATGTDARTHYYGMVADSGFFMRGRASAIPQTPRPGTVASGPTGPGSAGWDFDGSYGDWYGGHELGHTFGRFHAEFCGAGGGASYPFPNGQLSGPDERFVGLDVGDPELGLPLRVLRGTRSHDVMTYCDHEWLSAFTFRGIFDRLVAESALPARSVGGQDPWTADRASTVGAAGGEAPPMRLIAAVNITRTSGSIAAVLPLVVSDAEMAEAGRYDVVVRVRDDEGTVLDERPAVFVPSACEDPDDDVTGVVDMDVPAAPGAARIEVVVAGQVVDSQPVGGEAVPLGPPVTGPSIAGTTDSPGVLALRWQRPPESSGERYAVQVSVDDGATWRTVAVGLTEPAVSLPRAEYAGQHLTVRVLATTGSAWAPVRIDRMRAE